MGWFGIFVIYISNILLDRFNLLDSILKIWFGKFCPIDLFWYNGFGKLGLVAIHNVSIE